MTIHIILNDDVHPPMILSGFKFDSLAWPHRPRATWTPYNLTGTAILIQGSELDETVKLLDSCIGRPMKFTIKEIEL